MIGMARKDRWMKRQTEIIRARTTNSLTGSSGGAVFTPRGDYTKVMAMPEMMISAQFSIYSLRQEHLSPAIEALNDALRARGLSPEMGAMSPRS
jgi:hypothetical protein